MFNVFENDFSNNKNYSNISLSVSYYLSYPSLTLSPVITLLEQNEVFEMFTDAPAHTQN